MTLILPGLVLGSFQESFDRSILAKHNATHILNVAEECNVSHRIGLEYIKIGMPDDCLSFDMSGVLGNCINYIYHAHQTGGCVFVHCLEGVSRSACVVLCYMVVYKGWCMDDAYAHMLACRPVIDPFPEYLAQTCKYLSAWKQV